MQSSVKRGCFHFWILHTLNVLALNRLQEDIINKAVHTSIVAAASLTGSCLLWGINHISFPFFSPPPPFLQIYFSFIRQNSLPGVERARDCISNTRYFAAIKSSASGFSSQFDPHLFSSQTHPSWATAEFYRMTQFRPTPTLCNGTSKAGCLLERPGKPPDPGLCSAVLFTERKMEK